MQRKDGPHPGGRVRFKVKEDEAQGGEKRERDKERKERGRKERERKESEWKKGSRPVRREKREKMDRVRIEKER